MFAFPMRILITLTMLLAASAFCFGQDAEDRLPSSFRRDDPHSRRAQAVAESMEKMRITKEKKEFELMMQRGELVNSLAKRVDIAYQSTAQLTEREMDQLAEIEKLTKQIRNKLGGDDDDLGENAGAMSRPTAQAETMKLFNESVAEFYDQLKKTTRFTISAATIQNANDVLRYVRLLRGAQ